MKKQVLDTVATTIYHHDIDKSLNVLVVEQHDKVNGVIEFTLKIKHFGEYRTENPIRIYTNVPQNKQ